MITPRSILFFSYYIQSYSKYLNRDIPITLIFSSFGYAPSSSIVRSHASSIFSFLKNFHTVFCNYWIYLHSHQQHIRIPFSSCSCQFIIVILTRYELLTHCGLISVSSMIWTVSYTFYTLAFKSFVHFLLDHLFASYLFDWVPYTFEILTYQQIFVLQMFLHNQQIVFILY